LIVLPGCMHLMITKKLFRMNIDRKFRVRCKLRRNAMRRGKILLLDRTRLLIALLRLLLMKVCPKLRITDSKRSKK